MRILIAGGSGFIGTALTKSLLSAGHQVWILTRNPRTARVVDGAQIVGWDARTKAGWGDLVSQVEAIINLTGESIGGGLWNANQKKRILSSRKDAGKVISQAIQQAKPLPKVFIQASAVGIYGLCGGEPVTEESAPGSDFLANVCVEWEASSQSVEELGVRRVVIRTGVVLSKSEGALKRLMLPFHLFVGGPLGNGRQGFPWIHPTDEVESIRTLLETEEARGVYNLCAPELLSNAAFGRILAQVMRRPYWLPIPGFVLKLLLGEISSLVLEGQFMLPKRLKELGYKFRFATAELALMDLLKE
jgi:uncharacterized protein (TIGR01777 family)